MRALFLAAAMLVATPVYAQPAEAATENSEDDPQARIFAELKFKSGDIELPAANAVIHATEKYQFLDAKDSRKVLEQMWGNPPDSSILGMIVPKEAGLIGEHGWAVVLTYSDEGYISDKEAASMNYDDLIKELKASTLESNKERKAAGYGTIELHGWAAKPRYDAANSKLYWAKDLSFDGSETHTVNYDVRALGRHGYLSMNAVASLPDLPQVEASMQEIIKMAEFKSGARYADYNSATDKTATYGLAALLGAGVAAKSGLFAKLFALLFAMKKFAVVLLVGMFAGVKALAAKLFSKKSTASAGNPPPPPR